MNSTIFKLYGSRYIRQVEQVEGNDFTRLCNYIAEGDIWHNFICPEVTRVNDQYGCGNYYCTKRDGFDVLLTDFYAIDTVGSDMVVPVRVNENTVYGMSVAFHYMYVNKISQFALTQEGKTYTFYAPRKKPIVVDPDLGLLYNHTIPFVVMRKVYGKFICDIQNDRKEDDIYVYGNYTDTQLRLLCDLLVNNYSPKILKTIRSWPREWVRTNKYEKATYTTIRIANEWDCVHLTPVKQPNLPNTIDLVVSKDSLIKFLDAWESRLELCDTFTLVFLGHTIRFFEGEPLALIDKPSLKVTTHEVR
jgi:hypothetical protein